MAKSIFSIQVQTLDAEGNIIHNAPLRYFSNSVKAMESYRLHITDETEKQVASDLKKDTVAKFRIERLGKTYRVWIQKHLLDI
jgi:hypothetical protein